MRFLSNNCQRQLSAAELKVLFDVAGMIDSAFPRKVDGIQIQADEQAAGAIFCLKFIFENGIQEARQ